MPAGECGFDLCMPRLSGARAARLIEGWPEAGVLILTVSEDAAALQEALRSGARGFIPKRAAAESRIHAVRLVAAGGVYVHPLAGGAAWSPPRRGRGPRPAREAEVLRLIALGFSNKEIAARLRVSAKTVETHKARAMAKLGLYNRVEVVRHAARMGWLRELWAGVAREGPAAASAR
jgi:DNA-binding NarL/FixJ family response regulator